MQTRKQEPCERNYLTFVEQNNNFLEGLHEVDVVIAIFLDLQQKSKFWDALGCKSLQQWAVLLKKLKI